MVQIIPHKSKLQEIEDIKAINSVVRIRMKDGRKKWKKVSQMKKRELPSLFAEWKAICRDGSTQHLKEHYRELIDKVMNAMQEAIYQYETGEKNAVMVQNALQRKTQDGTPVDDTYTEDENIEAIKELYPGVEEDIVVAVLRDSDTYKEAEQEVGRIELERFRENGYQL